MGLLRKLKANFRLREHKRIDDSAFASYDMTEIGDSHSEGSVEAPSSNPYTKLQLVFEGDHSSLPPRQFELPPTLIEACASSVSKPDMSETAKAILLKAFPDVAFDESLGHEDLSQYPDPEPSICGSVSSDEDDDEDSQHVMSQSAFHGMSIDTSEGGTQPSRADVNDEFLVSSPIDAPSPQFSFPSSGAEIITTSLVQPRKNKLAHIFHEELSTLYEGKEDEGSLTSMEDIDAEEQLVDMMSPKEMSISVRWSNILEMTITGQCGDQRFILDEAEI